MVVVLGGGGGGLGKNWLLLLKGGCGCWGSMLLNAGGRAQPLPLLLKPWGLGPSGIGGGALGGNVCRGMFEGVRQVSVNCGACWFGF